ncbi:MAG TPA: Smr/MutS family protein [Candidatus Sulfotelmatobacter sp.]|nr:Smr/MutS family protein [Candidatus Sulfotelmatobacter sp.]
MPIRTVNLKSDMPLVREALDRLEREIKSARQDKVLALKIIHGYGSTGVGGDIRIAIQKRLHELKESGSIKACIFGENWAQSDEAAWALLRSMPELKKDGDLGRGNRGITIVVL